MNTAERQFYGKYRGVVRDNRDPQQRGRIRALVPDVFGEDLSGWALPCTPYAGKNVGLFLVPPQDASVWIEFEHGDPEYPVWSGCFWAEGEAPAGEATKKVLKTEIGTLTIDDTAGSGSITIATTAGMKIVVNSSGITIDDGQGASVKLSGPRVSINDGALEVT